MQYEVLTRSKFLTNGDKLHRHMFDTGVLGLVNRKLPLFIRPPLTSWGITD